MKNKQNTQSAPSTVTLELSRTNYVLYKMGIYQSAGLKPETKAAIETQGKALYGEHPVLDAVKDFATSVVKGTALIANAAYEVTRELVATPLALVSTLPVYRKEVHFISTEEMQEQNIKSAGEHLSEAVRSFGNALLGSVLVAFQPVLKHVLGDYSVQIGNVNVWSSKAKDLDVNGLKVAMLNPNNTSADTAVAFLKNRVALRTADVKAKATRAYYKKFGIMYPTAEVKQQVLSGTPPVQQIEAPVAVVPQKEVVAVAPAAPAPELTPAQKAKHMEVMMEKSALGLFL